MFACSFTTVGMEYYPTIIAKVDWAGWPARLAVRQLRFSRVIVRAPRNYFTRNFFAFCKNELSTYVIESLKCRIINSLHSSGGRGAKGVHYFASTPTLPLLQLRS